jgi:hypothetical protein
MNRSRTVGIPSFRTPPPGLGLSTRFTGLGRYVPANSDARIPGQGMRKYPGHASTLSPSIPGLPPFVLTRASAATRFFLSTTPSITRASATGAFPADTPTDASPLRSTKGSMGGLSGAVLRSSLLRSLLAIRSGLRPACAGPTMPSADSSPGISADYSALSQFPSHATSQGTGEVSRGKSWSLRRVDARFTKHTHSE